MSRVVAIGVTVTLLVVLFCCPPPALAAMQQPQLVVCPITGETCETTECDPPPNLTAAPATPPHVVMPDVAAVPPAPTLPTPHELRPAVRDFWSAPTRTTVLRI